MRRFLLFLFCAVVFSAQAQTVRTPVAAVYTSLGAYSAHHTTAFSFTNNQAALGTTKQFTAGVYGEKRFLLDALGLYQAAAIIPTASGNFGIKGGYFGNVDYNETNVGLAYGLNLGTKLSVGAQFNYTGFRATGYGSAGSINFEAGAIFHVSDQLHAGIHVYNPLGSKIGKDETEKLPSVYSMGIGYEPSETVFLSAEINKTENLPIDVRAGLQYTIDKKIVARAGFTSGTSTYYLGAGIAFKEFQVDAVATIHPQLGVTPGIMLLYNGKTE